MGFVLGILAGVILTVAAVGIALYYDYWHLE